MDLTATQIRYLLAIYQLSKKGDVPSWEIAENLDIARPSVHRMLGQLQKKDLITKEKYSLISLTEKGRHLAEQYQNGYDHIVRFLSGFLDLPSDAAETGALSVLSGLKITGIEELCWRINEKMPGREA